MIKSFTSQWNKLFKEQKEILQCDFMNEYSIESGKEFMKMINGKFPLSRRQIAYLENKFKEVKNG